MRFSPFWLKNSTPEIMVGRARGRAAQAAAARWAVMETMDDDGRRWAGARGGGSEGLGLGRTGGRAVCRGARRAKHSAAVLLGNRARRRSRGTCRRPTRRQQRVRAVAAGARASYSLIRNHALLGKLQYICTMPYSAPSRIRKLRCPLPRALRPKRPNTSTSLVYSSISTSIVRTPFTNTLGTTTRSRPSSSVAFTCSVSTGTWNVKLRW